MNPDWLHVQEGQAPMVLSIPHTGLHIPDDIAAQLRCTTSQALADTDWWVDKLYDFAHAMDITVVRSDISRTVVDLNRDPSGQSLYPGQTTTHLCPLEQFDGTPFYHQPLSAEEIEQRKARYFTPYHDAVSQQLQRLKAQHSKVVLFDAHSINSVCPRLFEGELPGLNLGTNSGASCAADLAELAANCLANSSFSVVTNGRFKGGWITRHYGQPGNNIHALQLEIAQRCYLDETHDGSHPVYQESRAAELKNQLTTLFTQLLHWARH